jgi:hypothetical protein
MRMSAVRESQKKKICAANGGPWMYADGWHRPFPIETVLRRLALSYDTPVVRQQPTARRVVHPSPFSHAHHTVLYPSIALN